MKTIFALAGLILLAGAFLLWRSLQAPIVFGEFSNAPRVAVIDVINNPQAYLHTTVSMEDTIVDQCTTMGCYFFFAAGGKQLRVDIATIAMDAPKGRNGRKARVEGRTVPYDKGYQFSASAVEFK